MTANGQPDASRAARVVLKHYVLGRLLFNVAPPGVDQTKFHSYKLPEENRAEKTFTPFEKTLLKVFFPYIYKLVMVCDTKSGQWLTQFWQLIFSGSY